MEKPANNIEKATQLRQQAVELMKQAQSLDGLMPFLVVHHHEYGASTYLTWNDTLLSEEMAAQVVGSDYEPDKEESLDIFYDLTIEDLTGLTKLIEQRGDIEQMQEEQESDGHSMV